VLRLYVEFIEICEGQLGDVAVLRLYVEFIEIVRGQFGDVAVPTSLRWVYRNL
jgi:hypothetical protein